MGLYCWGLNHKSVPVAIREQYALSQAGQLKALDSWDEEGPFAELVLLCTCNRCELYAVTKDSIPSAALLDYYLSLLPGRPPVDSSYYYTYSGKDCITHLLRVASSLDSLILGEGQILSQVKQAYQQAHERGTTGVILNMLFQQAISTGKKVRTDTHIAYHAVSVSYAAGGTAAGNPGRAQPDDFRRRQDGGADSKAFSKQGRRGAIYCKPASGTGGEAGQAPEWQGRPLGQSQRSVSPG